MNTGMLQGLGAIQASMQGIGASPAPSFREIKVGDTVLVTERRPYRVARVVGLASRYTDGRGDYVCVDYWNGHEGFWDHLLGSKRYEWLYFSNVSPITEKENDK